MGKRGRPFGSLRTLSSDQQAFIQKTIQDKRPDQIKLHFALWTRRAVQTLILEQYQIKMPIRSVGEYLRRWGFTPQQPLKRAYEQNPKKVILIIDNLPVHHSRPVKEWLETHKKEIEVHYLPSYSPERNPDEDLSRDLKHQVSNRPPARNRD